MASTENLNTKRTSLTIPKDLLDRLNRIASTLKISRSALVSHMLSEPTRMMCTMFDDILGDSDAVEGPSRRSTVHTQEVLQRELENMLNGLNSQQDMWDNRNGH
jgi:hypothetical protein